MTIYYVIPTRSFCNTMYFIWSGLSGIYHQLKNFTNNFELNDSSFKQRLPTPTLIPNWHLPLPLVLPFCFYKILTTYHYQRGESFEWFFSNYVYKLHPLKPHILYGVSSRQKSQVVPVKQEESKGRDPVVDLSRRSISRPR